MSTDHMDPVDLSAPLIVGYGITGRAVADALLRRGHVPIVIDDRADLPPRRDDDPLEVLPAPSDDQVDALVAAASVVLPSPGVPDHHRVFAAAAAEGVAIRSEFDLAAAWDNRPAVAVTGTNGKTTVTTIVTDALERSGIRAEAVGNTPVPLVAAIDDATIDVFVIEASSFRLAHSHHFAPNVATWLNFSPDHLDAHGSLQLYERAKASIWDHLVGAAIAVANAEDPVVMGNLERGDVRSRASVRTFGVAVGDWRVEDGSLVGPEGPLLDVTEMPRHQPHDLANAAAAAATASAAGADIDAIAAALRAFGGLPHRVEEIGSWNGVRWFDDSKATVPQSAVAAARGFDSVVLIAGGRNKGLDLSGLAEAVPPVHAVVAIGEAADEIVAVFEPTSVEVATADSMESAVERAAALARCGDVVLLSPACTSFDWYPDYGTRGDHFNAIVSERFMS